MKQSSFKADLAWSTQLFQDKVWPMIKPSMGGGDLIPMEGRPDVELANRLDMLAGIDAWQTSTLGMRGIASRVLADRGYRTFTMRKSRHNGTETEYSKRRKAINSNGVWIYPSITVQAYAGSKMGPILAVAIAYTSDIVDCIESGYCSVMNNVNASFYAIKWGVMQDNGYKIKVIA